MTYSERIEQAIQKASCLHRGQTRLTPERVPYIAHLFSVYILLSKYTKNEDVLVAGILHDAVEDTSYTLKELEDDFGSRVRTIVSAVTEEKEREGEPLPWRTRKEGYLRSIETASQEALLICAVDKMYNLKALVDDYERHGPSLFTMLTASPREKMWYHEEVLKILRMRLRHKRALKDLERIFDQAKELFYEPIERKTWGPVYLFTRTSAAVGGTVARVVNPLRNLKLSARIFGYGNPRTHDRSATER